MNSPSEHSSHIPREYEIKHSKWLRKMLHAYLVVVIVHFFVQIACYLFLKYDRAPLDFIVNVLFWPTALAVFCILLTSYMDRKFPSCSFYTMSVTSTVIAWTIIHVNYDIRIMPAICLLPIFASVLFFDKRRVWFICSLQMAAYGLLLIDPAYREYLSSFDMVSIPVFLILATFVAQIIVTSGVEVLDDLQTSMNAKEDLIVRNAIIAKQSKTDGLTNLYNQSSFKDYYEKAFEYANLGMSLHLALIDIDDFKVINDTYGHRVGDIILEKVSLIIQESITASDIAARYGGEEFALLMFEQSFEQAYDLVELIRQKISLMGHLELEGSSITVSIGLKGYNLDVSKDKLFEDVDACLYAAKRTGKNKTVTSLVPA
ncbi:GGDEF domain-containing protein [Paenibacillus sp. TSA_86.1]|uniref:GGDEF domain-containing protein n=1 Tax=Paenibacillus sp. TSA_86.1 TaxID=3415649 RepID=UPI0040463335